MKINKIVGMLGIAFLVTGCYKDKGEYLYKDINDVALVVTPTGNGISEEAYVFTQPQEDTLYVELKAGVTQTLQIGDENIQYRWILTAGSQKDTVYTSACHFSFPPQKKFSYDVLLSVTDRTTGLEIYKNLRLKTVVPFIRSWLVLHGKEGDRRIGAVEFDTSGIQFQRLVPDIYENFHGVRRFQNAFGLLYASGGAGYNVEKGDRLFILQPDSCTWMYPFTCKVWANQNQMMNSMETFEFTGGTGLIPGNIKGIMDKQGHYYHNGAWGYFYLAEAADELTDYHVDRACIAWEGDRAVTMWDAVHKRLMYYGYNWYMGYMEQRQDLSSFSARITLFPEDALKGISLEDKELLWMGTGLTNAAKTGSSVLFKKAGVDSCFLYHISYGGSKDGYSFLGGAGDEQEYVKTTLLKWANSGFNEQTVFASTAAFTEQLFYAAGSDVYLYNLASGEANFLYSVGDGKTITKLAFRKESQGAVDDNGDKILGIAVRTATGEGEMHQIVLNEAADVIFTTSNGGFGPIVDFCYTYIEHMLYD